jgi:hypothetical protein
MHEQIGLSPISNSVDPYLHCVCRDRSSKFLVLSFEIFNCSFDDAFSMAVFDRL